MNKDDKIRKLSKKKLNVIDIIKLYNIFNKLLSNDISLVEIFIKNYYYKVEDMPKEFYISFLNCVHSNNYKELFTIIISNSIYDLISFLKYNKIDTVYIESILTPKEYFLMKDKHINYIVNMLKNIPLSDNNITLKKNIINNSRWLLKKTCYQTEDECEKIAIKMYYSVGLDNAIEILNGKYGLVDYEIIYYLFNNLDIKNNKLNNNNNILNSFLFSNKKDLNNNLKQILNGNFLEVFINFDYFYNELSYFIRKLGTKINIEKLSMLLSERYLSSRLENPEVTGDILNDIVLSYYHKYGIEENENEIINKNINVYNNKLKKKDKSSIISTNIPDINEYSFELIKLSDIKNFVIGYRSGSCFRINGDAFLLFNDFLSNPNMRILSISTKEYKDFAMVLLMRNGNVLIAQGIEVSKKVKDNITGKKLYDAVCSSLKYIMDEMNKKDDEIVATIIGLSNYHTSNYNHSILPFIINPITNNSSYNGIYNYQALLHLKEDKSLSDIKLYIPEASYFDDEEILKRNDTIYQNDITYQKIEKILQSLRYARYKKDNYYNFKIKNEIYTECTLSWFITVFDDGTIDSFINSDNPNIIKQYNDELEIISKNIGKCV